jgi:hypothetical protein
MNVLRVFFWRSLPMPLLNAMKRIRAARAMRVVRRFATAQARGQARCDDAIELLLRYVPTEPQILFRDGDMRLCLNLAALRQFPNRMIRASIRDGLQRARREVSRAGRTSVACLDLQPFGKEASQAAAARALDADGIDRCLDAIRHYRSAARSLAVTNVSESRRLPEYDVGLHPALVRYGNTEARVVQNVIEDPKGLRASLVSILPYLNSERRMYAPSRASNHFAADDPEWNLRRLMTESGFYVGNDPVRAWEALENWAARYLATLRSSHLVWHNEHFPYFLRSQCALAGQSGTLPDYVNLPSAARIYEQLRGKHVLFLSPLAHLAEAQAASGRLRQLYRD